MAELPWCWTPIRALAVVGRSQDVAEVRCESSQTVRPPALCGGLPWGMSRVVFQEQCGASLPLRDELRRACGPVQPGRSPVGEPTGVLQWLRAAGARPPPPPAPFFRRRRQDALRG